MTDISTDRIGTQSQDVITVLLDQHAKIRALFTEIVEAEEDERQAPFDRLRALLELHEAAEHEVLRPSTRSIGATEVAEARLAEEAEARDRLAQLQELGTEHPHFGEELARFYQVLLTHAQAEETSEFPRILHEVPVETRLDMGRRLLDAEASGTVDLRDV